MSWAALYHPLRYYINIDIIDKIMIDGTFVLS